MNFSKWLDSGYGRVALTARYLKVSSARVSAMKEVDRVPSHHAPLVWQLSDGQVTPEESCPDFPWHILRDGPRSINAPAADAAVSIQVTDAAPAAANDEALDAPGRA
jgi:DNA-binding transcriptional regulator YdaS (Cro superfamily)